jgi:methyltransferase (TIGR00027 family)
VQIGTAYLFSPEATISGAHRQALRSGGTPTVVTNVITGRPARGIANRVINELGPLATDTPSFPLASTPLAPLRAAAEKIGSSDFSPVWAGQAYALGREMPASELTRTLATETLARFSTLAQATSGVRPRYSRADVERTGMTPVGLTARWIAASRAIESERADAIFHDPFARDLAGSEGFAFRQAMSGGMSTPDNRDPHLAIRTRFFDDALLQWAMAHESPQIVMLAAGMDSRAFRLDWPEGTVLFEVDRPEIFDYKEPILERIGAQPTCDRRVVRADLAGDWTQALVNAGFDATRVTAVSAEGLVMYLEEAEAIRLFETIERLVRPGSWLGLDFVNKEMLTSPYTAGLVQLLEKLGCPWHFGIANAESFFAQYGWKATLTLPGDPEASYGIWPFPPVPRQFPNVPRSYFARAERLAR